MRAPIAAVLLLITTGLAQAQFDAQLTKNCLRIEFDAEVAKPLVGIWYSEATDPRGFVNQMYSQFTADGVFDYQDRTCGATGCSQNQGHGLYAINAQGDGNYYAARIFNDVQRTNACLGLQFKVLDANTLQLQDGSVMQRVQQ